MRLMSVALLAAALVSTAGPAAAQGAVERITVHGASLAGNLEGDSADREVFVYLPPSYASAPERRYPVVYALHGYTANAEFWSRAIRLPESVDAAIASGAQEMIVVAPDGNSLHLGSMWSSSVTIGDWESFVADDLVSYIDANYRTIPARESRGLAGHSMGGYGTVRIGMKRPDVFSSLYIMSACCLGARKADDEVYERLETVKTLEELQEIGFLGPATFAVAAAWSANPDKPPFYVDLPTKDGVAQQDVLDRWAANAPNVMVHQYVPALQSFEAIAIDVGDEDPGLADIETLHETMTRLGIAHEYEMYEGDHGNRVGERWETHVMPFFSEHLVGD
jgi:enterochelin esterase-like enzyme